MKQIYKSILGIELVTFKSSSEGDVSFFFWVIFGLIFIYKL